MNALARIGTYGGRPVYANVDEIVLLCADDESKGSLVEFCGDTSAVLDEPVEEVAAAIGRWEEEFGRRRDLAMGLGLGCCGDMSAPDDFCDDEDEDEGGPEPWKASL